MIDAYERQITYLRLSVTELCNLRCKYCMPADGVCKKSHMDMLTEDEMIAAVETAASLGVRKLRITGGEPLGKPNILSICRRAHAIDGIEELCVTTNGHRLSALAKQLRAAGVNRVNLSIDTLNAEKYADITRGGKLSCALDGLSAALDANFDKIKLNTVLIGGFNDDEIAALAELTCQYPIDVRFIELMPIQEHDEFGPEAFLPAAAVLEKLPQLAYECDDGVARLYRLPGALGSVGLIQPISEQFCTRCNRLRLTADGKLKPCLHCADEFSIKSLSREEMRMQFERAILAKPRCHAPLSAAHRSQTGRSMNEIGG